MTVSPGSGHFRSDSKQPESNRVSESMVGISKGISLFRELNEAARMVRRIVSLRQRFIACCLLLPLDSIPIFALLRAKNPNTPRRWSCGKVPLSICS